MSVRAVIPVDLSRLKQSTKRQFHALLRLMANSREAQGQERGMGVAWHLAEVTVQVADGEEQGV